MYILDTDHLSILERGGTGAARLALRLSEIEPWDVATTIVSYDEQMRGWLAAVSRANTLERVVATYARLNQNLDLFREANVLPFDNAAAEQFRALRQAGMRTGTMDLRIASIAIVRDAILLSRNLKDFEDVPGLAVENWCD